MLCLSVTKWTLDASDLKYDKKKKASLTLPIGNQSAKYHLQKIQTKKCLNLPGIEPGISGSVDRRLIHWAIGPYERIMIAVVFSTELMWFWFLMLAWMRNINTRFFGSMFGRNVRGNEDRTRCYDDDVRTFRNGDKRRFPKNSLMPDPPPTHLA